jgi:hypothetical protein
VPGERLQPGLSCSVRRCSWSRACCRPRWSRTRRTGASNLWVRRVHWQSRCRPIPFRPTRARTTQQQRLEPSLLPTGTSRVISVSGKPAWPVGFVTMKVHLIYPGRTEATTKELIYAKRVLVVNAIVPIVSILLISCASVLWWVRRRRRREPQGRRLAA